MKLPYWLSTEHPVARREAALWRRGLRRWWWVLLPFMALPCLCSGLCSLSALPIAFDPDAGPWGFVVVGGWALIMGVSVTAGLMQWGLGTAANVGGAIMISRERETQNWALLRVSALSIREIVAAKIAALMRVLAWPTLIGVGLTVGGTGLLTLSAIILLLVVGVADPDTFPLSTQFGIVALALIAIVPTTAYLVLVTLFNMLYNAVVGLATSAFMRTSASAVALSFAVHFAINLFIFLPIQQVVSIIVQVLGGLATLATQSPLAFVFFLPFGVLIAPVIIQGLVGLGATVVALVQAEKVVE